MQYTLNIPMVPFAVSRRSSFYCKYSHCLLVFLLVHKLWPNFSQTAELCSFALQHLLCFWHQATSLSSPWSLYKLRSTGKKIRRRTVGGNDSWASHANVDSLGFYFTFLSSFTDSCSFNQSSSSSLNIVMQKTNLVIVFSVVIFFVGQCDSSLLNLCEKNINDIK